MSQISNQDRRWLEAALKLSEKSTFPTYKMGCLLVSGGHVLSLGINKPSPGVLKDQRYRKKSLHCELDCLIGVKRELLKGSRLYIAGKSPGGNLIKSKPCGICYAMIVEVGIKKVFYYDRDGSIDFITPC